ncbi:MAG: hypothetical protein H0U95_15465 [Bacteroidetes bacterium]|nr:hypothetical protein [Bacteroidota bacterium]
MNEEEVIIQFRQYFHKEIPALVGTSKWNLNRDLRPHRKTLGKRNGNRWRFEQVLMILQIYGIAYTVDKH